MQLPRPVEFLKEVFAQWSEDKAPQLGASLAYYSLFSLAPLLVIAISVAGLVFGEEAARGQVAGALNDFLGRDGAAAVETMIENARKPAESSIAAAIGLVMLVFGASGVFAQLKDSLNTIWEVKPRANRGLWGTFRDRFLSVAAVLGAGFLLLTSLVITTAISAMSSYLGGLLPGSDAVWHVVNLAVSFAIITVLFALMFKFLPDVRIRWHDVWIGATLTAALFLVGKYAIGLYLGHSSVGSAYGAAGSLVVVLVWMYYSAQILFFGAEFTQVYANRYGSRIRPSKDAVPLTEAEREQQGIPHRQRPARETPRRPANPHDW